MRLTSPADQLPSGPVQYSSEGEVSRSDPMFAGPINNVTVNVGREAVLECHVNNLRQYKVGYLPCCKILSFLSTLPPGQVGWLKAGDQTILALHKRVITHNARVSVSHEDNRVGGYH